MLEFKKFKINKYYLYPFFRKRVKIKFSLEADKGMEGIILDENKDFFYVKTNNGIKKIKKRSHIFLIYLDGDWREIWGDFILFDPLERIKKLKKYL